MWVHNGNKGTMKYKKQDIVMKVNSIILSIMYNIIIRKNKYKKLYATVCLSILREMKELPVLFIILYFITMDIKSLLIKFQINIEI